jgi:hypothetical protein
MDKMLHVAEVFGDHVNRVSFLGSLVFLSPAQGDASLSSASKS